MLPMTRQERIEAFERWDRAYNRRQAEAVVASLADIFIELDSEPTLGDLVAFVDVSGQEPHTVDVPIGALVGRSGAGPTIADVVESLEDLEPDDLDLIVSRRLADLLDGL